MGFVGKGIQSWLTKIYIGVFTQLVRKMVVCDICGKRRRIGENASFKYTDHKNFVSFWRLCHDCDSSFFPIITNGIKEIRKKLKEVRELRI